MSATPIPRSVALAEYGDLDILTLRGFPSHRKGYKTYLRNPESRDKIYEFLESTIQNGNQAFVIYPIIFESEKLSLESAEEGYSTLKTRFPNIRIDFLHGKMKEEEKVKKFANFESGNTDILVATSLVEVGIDVPNATLMIIEDAGFFGLAQLHQLRGRVGRGNKEGTCILITKEKPNSEAYNRLSEFASTNDGFIISELDLKYRGEGDTLGDSQCGKTPLKYADPFKDLELLNLAVVAAKNYLDEKSEERDKWIEFLTKQYGKSDDKSIIPMIAL